MIFSKNALTVLVLSYSSRDALVSGADFYMWKLGHMDGPHDESQALGISRDGKFAVGTTEVNKIWKAWRADIDWLISTDDQLPPLENELFVQQEVGKGAAYCSSNLDPKGLGLNTDNYNLDKEFTLICPWGGSLVAGKIMEGTNPRFGLLSNVDGVCNELDSVDSILTPDFGGGVRDIIAKDISSDGSIIVGYGTTNNGKHGFIANEEYIDGVYPDEEFVLFRNDTTTARTFKTSQYEACSADGIYIVGYGTKTRNGDNVAYISKVLESYDTYTETVTLETVELPALDGRPGDVEAYAITTTPTPTGEAIVVGGTSNGKAVIWFQEEIEGALEWVVKDIGKCTMGQPFTNSKVTGIIATPGGEAGEYMAIGTATTNFEQQEAFIWKGNAIPNPDPVVCPDFKTSHLEALYRLEYVLTKTGAGEESAAGSSWAYTNANGIAVGEDHHDNPFNIRIVGFGTNPERGIEAWLMDGVPYHNYLFTHD